MEDSSASDYGWYDPYEDYRDDGDGEVYWFNEAGVQVAERIDDLYPYLLHGDGRRQQLHKAGLGALALMDDPLTWDYDGKNGGYMVLREDAARELDRVLTFAPREFGWVKDKPKQNVRPVAPRRPCGRAPRLATNTRRRGSRRSVATAASSGDDGGPEPPGDRVGGLDHLEDHRHVIALAQGRA